MTSDNSNNKDNKEECRHRTIEIVATEDFLIRCNECGKILSENELEAFYRGGR